MIGHISKDPSTIWIHANNLPKNHLPNHFKPCIRISILNHASIILKRGTCVEKCFEEPRNLFLPRRIKMRPLFKMHRKWNKWINIYLVHYQQSTLGAYSTRRIWEATKKPKVNAAPIAACSLTQKYFARNIFSLSCNA